MTFTTDSVEKSQWEWGSIYLPKNTPEYPRIPLKYPKIPLECPRIPQNTNNIKILKNFGFLFIFYSV
jgi:hypothetical protein